MHKLVVVATATLVVAGSSIAAAQQSRGDREDRMGRWQPSAEDIAAFADARIAGLKAGLRLNPDQERNWAPFEEAYRALAKQRAERRAARANEPRPGDMLEFMQRRAEAMTQRAAGLKQLVDAAAPLYQSLDDGQKRRFAILSRMLRPQPMMMHGRMMGAPMGLDQMGREQMGREQTGREQTGRMGRYMGPEDMRGQMREGDASGREDRGQRFRQRGTFDHPFLGELQIDRDQRFRQRGTFEHPLLGELQIDRGGAFRTEPDDEDVVEEREDEPEFSARDFDDRDADTPRSRE